MSAPFRIVDQTIDLSPAMSAAVADVDIGVTDTLRHVCKNGSVAEAVADLIVQHIVGIQIDPALAVIMRDTGILLRDALALTEKIKAGSQLLFLRHGSVRRLGDPLQRSKLCDAGFTGRLCRLAVDNVPVDALVGDAVAVVVVDHTVAAGVAVAFLITADDGVFHDIAGAVVVVGLAVDRLVAAAEIAVLEEKLRAVDCQVAFGKLAVDIKAVGIEIAADDVAVLIEAAQRISSDQPHNPQYWSF